MAVHGYFGLAPFKEEGCNLPFDPGAVPSDEGPQRRRRKTSLAGFTKWAKECRDDDMWMEMGGPTAGDLYDLLDELRRLRAEHKKGR